MFEELKANCSDTLTLKLINEARALTIKHSVLSIMAGLIVEVLFMLFSVYNVAQRAENE